MFVLLKLLSENLKLSGKILNLIIFKPNILS